MYECQKKNLAVFEYLVYQQSLFGLEVWSLLGKREDRGSIPRWGKSFNFQTSIFVEDEIGIGLDDQICYFHPAQKSFPYGS